jgi:hypothetical protein
MIGGKDLHIHPLADLGPVVLRAAARGSTLGGGDEGDEPVSRRRRAGEIQALAEVSQALP